jgi:hypothetical protein
VLENLYLEDKQEMNIMIDFRKMSSEDGRWMEPNRSGPVQDFYFSFVKSFNGLSYYYYY